VACRLVSPLRQPHSIGRPVTLAYWLDEVTQRVTASMNEKCPSPRRIELVSEALMSALSFVLVEGTTGSGRNCCGLAEPRRAQSVISSPADTGPTATPSRGLRFPGDRATWSTIGRGTDPSGSVRFKNSRKLR